MRPPPPPNLTTRRAIAENEITTTPVIFEGKVDHIELRGWPIKPVPGKTVSLIPRVLVGFSGVHLYRGKTENFVVETGLGGGDCGYRFEKGESYLVFAWKGSTGELTTGICSATRLLEDAGTQLRLLRGEAATPEDLADLRNEQQERTRPAPHQLCGKVAFPGRDKVSDVTVYFWPAQDDPVPMPVAEADASQDGSFCSEDLDPGAYIVGGVEGTRPSHYVAYFPGVLNRSQATPVTLPAEGGGPRVDFSLRPRQMHRVRGYVRGFPEIGNEGLQVMLIPSPPDVLTMLEPVAIGLHGFFELPNVPSGHYSAFAFSPSDDDETMTFLSTAVEVDVSENVEGLTLEFVPKK